MKNFSLNLLGVEELSKNNLIEINGGQMITGPSPWWSLAGEAIKLAVTILRESAEAYIEYSKKTGGEYVIHHAQ